MRLFAFCKFDKSDSRVRFIFCFVTAPSSPSQVQVPIVLGAVVKVSQGKLVKRVREQRGPQDSTEIALKLPLTASLNCCLPFLLIDPPLTSEELTPMLVVSDFSNFK